MHELWTFLECGLAAILGIATLYILVRITSLAWYHSKYGLEQQTSRQALQELLSKKVKSTKKGELD